MRPGRPGDASQIEPFLAAETAAPYSDNPRPLSTPSPAPFSAPARAPVPTAPPAAARAPARAPPADESVFASQAYPPPSSASSYSGTGTGTVTGMGPSALTVANGGGGTPALTPAQRKAAEAASEKKDGPDADLPVQYHADSGVRFDSEGKAIEAEGSGSHAPEPLDVPPEYTET